MNVLFVDAGFPNRIKEYLILPSLELCISSALLKEAGYTVDLIDMKINRLTLESIIGYLPPQKPDIICINDEPKTHCTTVKLIPWLRKIYGNSVLICLRGEIASFIPQTVLERNEDLDLIVLYDDDYALLRVAKCLENKGDLSRIPNIAYRNNSSEICVNKRLLRNYLLDELPLPDRKLYDIEKYLHRDSETIVRSSRGCPGKCLFCIKTRFEQFGLFSIKRFVDEIEILLKMGFSSFFFSDDTFAFSDERLKEFYDEIQRRNLRFRWTSNMRITDINEYKLKLMKEIGAYRVFVGIETVNADTSARILKGLTADYIKEKTDLLHKYGIEFHASFILGNPGDNEQDLERTIEFVRQIQPTLVTFNLIRIYPGLEMYDNPEKFEIVMPDPFWYEKDDWTRNVVMGTLQLPPKVLETWSRRCLFEFINMK